MESNTKYISTSKYRSLSYLKSPLPIVYSLRYLLRNYREKFTHITLKNIKEGKIFIPVLYILFQKRSKKYLVGGLSKYKYSQAQSKSLFYRGNQSISRAIWLILFTEKTSTSHIAKLRNVKFNPLFSIILNESSQINNSAKINKWKVLSLLPASWARNSDDLGFPHAYHFFKSAEIANLTIIDFPTEAVSANPISQTFKDKKTEWELIEKLIVDTKVKVVVLSGHKRSFDDFNLSMLLKLKSKYGLIVLLLMLDDWSIDYLSVVQSWSSAIDKVLVYESNNIISREFNHDKVLVWPFPRMPVSSYRSKINTTSFGVIKFFGSPYLNRIPWLFFISLICRKYPDLKIEFDSETKIGKHKKSVQDYLDVYSQGQVTLHFLERTPGIYSFTSSVWDAFAGGSLVIAQVGVNHDPIADFFRPGTDYLPFSTVTELLRILENLRSQPTLIDEISISGQKFMQQNYNPKRLFEYLFNQITNTQVN